MTDLRRFFLDVIDDIVGTDSDVQGWTSAAVPGMAKSGHIRLSFARDRLCIHLELS